MKNRLKKLNYQNQNRQTCKSRGEKHVRDYIKKHLKILQHPSLQFVPELADCCGGLKDHQNNANLLKGHRGQQDAD